MSSIQESASVCNQARIEQTLREYRDYYRGLRKERPREPKPDPTTFNVREAVKALGPLGAGEAKALVKEAAELEAYDRGKGVWAVWCRYCVDYHHHGAEPGHRVAHCAGPNPYSKTGYILRDKGLRWEDRLFTGHGKLRHGLIKPSRTDRRKRRRYRIRLPR